MQIETPQAIENVGEIAAVEGVDGLFIGPGDLSMRLERTETALTLDTAIEKVADAARKHNKAWGLPAGSVEKVQQYCDQGATLINHGGEFHAFMTMLENCSKDLDKVYT